MQNSPAPHYPHFSDINLRRSTFVNYNGHWSMEDIEKIIRCGYYLLDNKSIISCFHCNVSTNDYAIGTDFAMLHLKIAPHCSYMKTLYSQRKFRNALRQSHFLRPATSFRRVQSPFCEKQEDCYNRLVSLKKLKTKANKKTIARSGFFLNKKKKLVCFECGLCLEAGEEFHPWKAHCIQNRRCKYLLITRGFYYIQSQLE